MKVDRNKRAQRARELFMEGYNCTQSVVLAFEDVFPIDQSMLTALVAPFGGGMGRLREVCGAVSGMTFVAGMITPYTEVRDQQKKALLYSHVQNLANRFREENGSIICRELLGLSIKGADSPCPSPRTDEYYKKRPCPELIEIAAGIVADYINDCDIEFPLK